MQIVFTFPSDYYFSLLTLNKKKKKKKYILTKIAFGWEPLLKRFKWTRFFQKRNMYYHTFSWIQLTIKNVFLMTIKGIVLCSFFAYLVKKRQTSWHVCMQIQLFWLKTFSGSQDEDSFCSFSEYICKWIPCNFTFGITFNHVSLFCIFSLECITLLV